MAKFIEVDEVMPHPKGIFLVRFAVPSMGKAVSGGRSTSAALAGYHGG